MIQRRGFLGAILAGMAAPAIVRSGSIMRINPAIIAAPRFGISAVCALTSMGFTREALRILHSKRDFIANINREYESAWQPGAMIKIRKPSIYVSEG